MGQDPTEYEAGVNCPTCWGIGKEWGEYPTPRFVFCTFEGIIACPDKGDAPNGTFQLLQVPAEPCHWNKTIPNWWLANTLSIDWYVSAGPVMILIASVGGMAGKYFLKSDIICTTSFANGILACNGVIDIGHHGTGVIH